MPTINSLCKLKRANYACCSGQYRVSRSLKEHLLSLTYWGYKLVLNKEDVCDSDSTGEPQKHLQ